MQAAGVEPAGSGPVAQQRQLLDLAAERLAAVQAAAGQARAASASSNYDFVKIKVRLGSHLEHYYILSRFLLSRMLTVITLPQHKVRRHGWGWHAAVVGLLLRPAVPTNRRMCAHRRCA